jgi:acid phosphatase type 7
MSFAVHFLLYVVYSCHKLQFTGMPAMRRLAAPNAGVGMRIARAVALLGVCFGMVLALPAGGSAATAGGDPVIAAAGDIACKRIAPSGNKCWQMATSDLILAHTPTVDRVLTLGDNVYPCGSYGEFLQGYDPTWGRFLDITQAAIGNHEYLTGDTGCNTQATGYFQYFGTAHAQPNGADGYYSFDLAGSPPSTSLWRVIVLNANCTIVSCAAGSPQEHFLASAISSAPSGSCIMATWHQPRFSGSGLKGKKPVKPFWDDLYAAHAALILNGHAHYYERYVSQDVGGIPDAAGITEIIVGTGGVGLGSAKVIASTTAHYDNTHFGVLFVTLRAASFDWQFTSIDGVARDSGSAPCTPRL